MCCISRFRNVHASSTIDAQTTPAFEEISLREANSGLSINNDPSPGHQIPLALGDAEDMRRGHARHRYSVDNTSIANSDTRDGVANVSDRASSSRYEGVVAE